MSNSSPELLVVQSAENTKFHWCLHTSSSKYHSLLATCPHQGVHQVLQHEVPEVSPLEEMILQELHAGELGGHLGEDKLLVEKYHLLNR